ncbi:hypothetical protein C0992_008938 [Termitomyces sp. T32_za158]|nr:hypothetical protein C0992_008938 [Termitomyces sp. T32_za158]
MPTVSYSHQKLSRALYLATVKHLSTPAIVVKTDCHTFGTGLHYSTPRCHCFLRQYTYSHVENLLFYTTMGKHKISGVSRKVRLRNLDTPRRPGTGRSHYYGLNGLERERERAEKRYEQSIQGLSAETRQVLAEIQGTNDTGIVDANDDFLDSWEDEVPPAPDEFLDFAARDMIDSR